MSSPSGSRFTSTTPASCSAPRSTPKSTRRRNRALREGEDVEELHVQPVRRQARELRDPYPLLEDEHELLALVVDRVELVEAEPQRRRLLAVREQQLGLDVVRPVELGALAERQLPGLARRDPILDSRGVNGQGLLDHNIDSRVIPLGRRRPWQDFEDRHLPCLSTERDLQT